MSHSGSITGSLRMPFAGHPLIKLDAISQGSTGSGKWNAQLNISGVGQSWKNIDWVMSAPTLAWSGKHPVQLTQLVGHVTQRWPTFELNDLTLPERPHLQAKAAADVSREKFGWYFWLDAGGLPKALSTPLPIDFSINAWGDRELYTVHDMNLRIADLGVWAGGTYDNRIPNPVNLDVVLRHSPQISATAPIQGHLGGEFKITGALFKGPDNTRHPQLGIAGRLHSNDLVVLDHRVGDIDAQLTGFVDNTDVKVQTTEMRLLQGKWKISANYPTSEEGVAFKVDVHDLPLDQVAAFAKLGERNVTLSGQLAEASCRLELPRTLDPARVAFDSNYVLVGLDANGFKADRIEGNATLDGGVLKLAPLAAQNGPGRLDAAATWDMSNPRHVITEAKLVKWPAVTRRGTRLALSAETRLDVDLQHKGATGPLTASATFELHDTSLIHAGLIANLRGRLVELENVSGTALGGTFEGTAVADLDKLLRARGNIQWRNVDAAALTSLAPQLQGLGGIYSGTIAIGPARDPRPLEPVRIDINIGVDGGHYRTVNIGDHSLVAMHAVAYANTDRAVLDHSDIYLADGVAHIWARGGQGLLSQALEINFEGLQLDQIARLNPKRKDPMPGLVSGRFALIGSGLDTEKLHGQGQLTLTQSDLGNWGPIAALYNAMHAGGGAEPSGTGTASLRFEQNTLSVPVFRYFNRGIEARGIFVVGPSVWNIPNTLIGGQVVGTLRPLKDTRMPLLVDVDQVFNALQSSLTAINVLGTVDQPVYVQALVGEIGSSMKALLAGDARAAGASGP
jgi:hypothetical protein